MEITGRLSFFQTVHAFEAYLVVEDEIWVGRYASVEDAMTVMLLGDVIGSDEAYEYLTAVQAGSKLTRQVTFSLAMLIRCGFQVAAPQGATALYA